MVASSVLLEASEFDDEVTVLQARIKSNRSALIGKKAELNHRLKKSWSIHKVPGCFGKLSMMPQHAGVRIWFNADSQQLGSIEPFLNRFLSDHGLGDCDKTFLSRHEIAVLREASNKYKDHMESLGTKFADRGLSAVDNLSEILKKRKDYDSEEVQSHVSNLMEITKICRQVVAKKIKTEPEKKKVVKEDVESLATHEDDSE